MAKPLFPIVISIVVTICARVEALAPTPASVSRAQHRSKPEITQRPLLRRADDVTLAWSSETQLGTVSWYPITFNPDEYQFTTSDSTWFRACAKSTDCPMYTSCSDGSMIAADTSYYCATTAFTSSTPATYICGTDYIFDSMGQTSAPLTSVWCDDIKYGTATTRSNYRQNPTAPASSSLSSLSISSSTPSPSSSAAPPASKSHAGVIAGATVAGVAVIGAVVLGALWILRRKKAKPVSNAEGEVQAPAPFEDKPQGVDAINYGQGGYYQQVAKHEEPQEVPEIGGNAVPKQGSDEKPSELPASK